MRTELRSYLTDQEWDNLRDAFNNACPQAQTALHCCLLPPFPLTCPPESEWLANTMDVCNKILQQPGFNPWLEARNLQASVWIYNGEDAEEVNSLKIRFICLDAYKPPTQAPTVQQM